MRCLHLVWFTCDKVLSALCVLLGICRSDFEQVVNVSVKRVSHRHCRHRPFEIGAPRSRCPSLKCTMRNMETYVVFQMARYSATAGRLLRSPSNHPIIQLLSFLPPPSPPSHVPHGLSRSLKPVFKETRPTLHAAAGASVCGRSSILK